jgi:hypothetical protein
VVEKAWALRVEVGSAFALAEEEAVSETWFSPSFYFFGGGGGGTAPVLGLGSVG